MNPSREVLCLTISAVLLKGRGQTLVRAAREAALKLITGQVQSSFVRKNIKQSRFLFRLNRLIASDSLIVPSTLLRRGTYSREGLKRALRKDLLFLACDQGEESPDFSERKVYESLRQTVLAVFSEELKGANLDRHLNAILASELLIFCRPLIFSMQSNETPTPPPSLCLIL